MIQNTSISEILAYVLAAILIGYGLRTPSLMFDPTTWVALGAAMGFAIVGVIIRLASQRVTDIEREKLTEIPPPLPAK